MIAAIVIPARLGSSRLPRKIMAEIGGKPMLKHVCERASRCARASSVVVAADDPEVVNAVTDWGFKAILTSTDLPSGTARIASVVEEIDAQCIVNLQADEPLIEPMVLDRVIDAIDDGARIATPVFQVRNPGSLSNPNVVKVTRRGDGRALYFSRSAIPYLRDVPLDEWIGRAKFWGHIGVYAFHRDVLLDYHKMPEGNLERWERLEQLRLLEAGLDIQTVAVDYEPMSVDTLSDLEHVRAYFQGSR